METKFTFKGQLYEILHSMNEVINTFEAAKKEPENIHVRFTVDVDELISTIENLIFIAGEHQSMPNKNPAFIFNRTHVIDTIKRAKDHIKALQS